VVPRSAAMLLGLSRISGWVSGATLDWYLDPPSTARKIFFKTIWSHILPHDCSRFTHFYGYLRG
jgi:hypothetical protein